MGFRIERIRKDHDRSDFDCGDPAMNAYLHRYGRQNDTKETSRTFVAIRDGELKVLGYYTLSASSISFQTLPPSARRGLARYPIPVAHLGRLAIDRSVQGQGLGSALLIDALRRIARVSADMAVFAVEVIALHENARDFYLKYGFEPLDDDRLHLYLPIQTVHELLKDQE